MTDHYFARDPKARSAPFKVLLRARGIELALLSDSGVFSSRGLDRGTRLLIEATPVSPGDLVLDLGSGYGALGLFAAHVAQCTVVMVDVNPRAAALAAMNARRLGLVDRAMAFCGDGAEALAEECFDLVLCNPPIRAGAAVVEGLLRGAARVLKRGGSICAVARTRQGAGALERTLAEHYAAVELLARGGGFRAFAAVRQ